MMISELLNKLELNDVDDVDKEGNTVLHLTVANETLTQKEMIEAIEVVLDKGIDPNTKNDYNVSALYLAVKYRLKDVVDYLIARKSNMDLIAHFFIEIEHSRFSKWTAQKNNSDEWISRMQKIERDSANFVEWLISRGFDFDCKSQKNQSALHMAIALNLQHILPVLLKYTKDINSVDEKNNTLLHIFLEKNYDLSYISINENWYSERYTADIVKTLLDRGLSADAENKNKLTPIHIAIMEEKDISVIELLLEGCVGIHSKYKDVETLLQMAMKRFSLSKESKTEYHLKVLRSLIAKGADINELDEPDEHGHTPLCLAVSFLNMHAINFLRDNEADFSLTTKDGENLLHLLIRCKGCSKADNKEMILIDLLISKGCQVNAKDVDGDTPLHDAVTYDDVAIVQKLIEHGAELNCKTSEGSTPLSIATLRTRNIHVVDVLRKSGADFNVTMKGGRTVLHLLAMQANRIHESYDKQLALFKSIVSGGCQVKVKDATGSSPIHLAARYADAAVVHMLIDCGADVNCRNNQKETPLHFSATNSDYSDAAKIAELLLKHGANVNAKDSRGRSALHKIALEPMSDSLSSVPFGTLLRYGADIDAQDINGLSVLCCVQIRNSQDYEQQCREYVKKYNESLLEKYYSERGDRNDVEDCQPEQMTIADCPLEKKASDVLAFLTEYALKLKAANLPRSEIIDSWLAEVTQFTGIWKHHERYYGEFLEEVEKLKSKLIDQRTSLYTWLHMDLNRRCAYVNSEKLKDIALPSTFKLQLQIMHLNYSILISANYNEAVTRKTLLEPAKQAWMQLTKNALPDLCVECIFSFLSNADLFNIIEED